MKREIFALLAAVALVLTGCATTEEATDYGATGAETQTTYGSAASEHPEIGTDYGRGEVWRSTPEVLRERGGEAPLQTREPLGDVPGE